MSRDGTLRVVDLRAIPWVFAWMQNRHLLPAWSTLVGVQALAQPGYLIEVEAVAVID